MNYVDEVLEHCEASRAFDKATHAPYAGTSAVSMFHEKVQVDLPFLNEIIALRAMVMYAEYSFLFPGQSANPREVWDVFCGGRLGIFGPPKGVQMDEGGECQNEIWTDLRAKRRIGLQFQGPWGPSLASGAAQWLCARNV